MEGFRAHCLTGSLSAMDKPVVRDAALLIFRATLGLIFVAHGWQKLFMDGPVETAGKLSAYIVGGGELLGGALLVVGLLTTLAAGALALLMLAALYFVHLNSGLFIADGGFEYVLVLIVSLLMIVVFGSGRASIDGVLSR